MPIGNEMSDHDLLISLNSRVSQIKEAIDDIAPVIKQLNDRQTGLESVVARHSEKLTAVRSDVSALRQEKMNKTEIDSLRADIEDLQDKSNTWNIINSTGVAIATVLAVVFGRS